MARLCPDCAKPLIPESFDGVTLDVCPLCAGIWFDMGEFGRIVREGEQRMEALESQALPEVHPRPNPQSKRYCPCCAETLSGYHYLYSSPIELDACEKCGGFWVEDGEIHRIDEWRDTHTLAHMSEEHRAEAALALANFEIQHDAAMQRQRNITDFLRIAGRRPWWSGRFTF